MREMPVPARLTPVQSPRLVILLMRRMVLVCPPLSSWLCGHTVSPQLPCLCLALSFDSLLFGLPPHALTASISIGRVPQTR
jgi:hypothetical protein